MVANKMDQAWEKAMQDYNNNESTDSKKKLSIFVQVNTSGEGSKSGVAPILYQGEEGNDSRNNSDHPHDDDEELLD